MELTTAEAAYISGCSTATIRRHIRLGRLDAWQKSPGCSYMIDWDELDCWMAWAWRFICKRIV